MLAAMRSSLCALEHPKYVVNDPFTEKIKLVDMNQKRRYKDFWSVVGKIKLSMHSVWM